MPSMPLPNLQQFKEILMREPLDTVVERYIFGGETYAFRERPESLNLLKNHLSTSLAVSTNEVTVIGSGKVGFALSPDNFGRPFGDESDVDVLIVNEGLFDRIWTTLLEWNYPRRYRLVDTDWNWAKKRMDDLYWGWFRPDKVHFKGLSFPEVLKPLRDISTTWFNAFQGLSTHAAFVGPSFSGRLYRTWHHARLYHIDGLRRLQDAIRATGA